MAKTIYGDSSVDNLFSSPAPAQVGPTREAGIINTRQQNQLKSYDITNTYDWTSVPTNSDYRKEAPSAMITAYKLEYSQLQQFIDGYINIAVAETEASLNPGLDPGMAFYRNMYKTTEQLASFNFPFFSDDIRSFTTEFADTFSPISQRGAKFMGAKTIMGLGEMGESLIGGTIAGVSQVANMGGNAVSDKIAAGAKWATEKVEKGYENLTGLKMPGLQTVGAPGSYIETPQFYQYGNTDTNLDINFVLSNTINGKEGYTKNQTFIKEFTKMNRPRRLGAIGMTFPAIYHIEVPGLRYIEWAFLSNFSIGLMGARRKIDNEILPEAFRCQFSFRSLTMEAANFMDKIDTMAPYDATDSGYIALRTRADEARAKTIAEQKKADEKRREAQRKKTEEERIAGAIAAAPEDARADMAADAEANRVAKERQLKKGQELNAASTSAQRAQTLADANAAAAAINS